MIYGLLACASAYRFSVYRPLFICVETRQSGEPGEPGVVQHNEPSSCMAYSRCIVFKDEKLLGKISGLWFWVKEKKVGGTTFWVLSVTCRF